MAKGKPFQVPKHAKKVNNDLGGFWKPDEVGQGLQGVVGHMVEIPPRNPKEEPNRFYTLRVTSEESGPIVTAGDKPVKAELGMLVGVGSRMVANFMSEHLGREVVLVFKGLGKAKPGRSAAKLFDTYDLNEDGMAS